MAEKRRPCQKCGRNRAERFFTSARGRTCSSCRKKTRRYATRADHLMNTYGITEDEYAEMLEAQGGGCAITGTRPYGKVHLDVDHDHAEEKRLLALGYDPQVAARMSVRGLLSRAANRKLLPAVRDDVGKLAAAIDYLTNPPAKRILTNP